MTHDPEGYGTTFVMALVLGACVLALGALGVHLRSQLIKAQAQVRTVTADREDLMRDNIRLARQAEEQSQTLGMLERACHTPDLDRLSADDLLQIKEMFHSELGDDACIQQPQFGRK